MKTRHFLALMAILASLPACGGGGGKTTDSDKSAALSACEPSSGPTGTKVVCEVKGMTEDSTLFFDKKPVVDFLLNEEDGVVSFTVPPTLVVEQTDKNVKKIYFQGGESVNSVGTFEVTGGTAPAEDEVVAAGDTIGGTTGDGGEVINPSTPGGTTGGTTGGTSETPPDSDGDGVPDTSDACPDTVSGKTVDATGCEPPPPQPTNAEITEFTVEKAKKSDQETEFKTDPLFSTYKIHWTFTNAKAAYLAGNIFNRASTDSALPADEQCKMVGDAPYNRYLVTAATGKAINPNLDVNATKKNVKKQFKYYLEGKLCDDTKPAQECKTGSYSLKDEKVSKAYAFAGDPLLGKDTYFYGATDKVMIKEDLQFDYMEAKPDIIQYIPLFPTVVEVNPKCRIDLKKDDGTAIANDTIFTQSFVHYGSVCLAVQGNDDAWVVKCRTVNAPEATIESSSADVREVKIGETADKKDIMKTVLHVDFDYKNAKLGVSSVSGCLNAKNKSSHWNEFTGEGSFAADCEIGGKTADLSINVSGVGEANTATKEYHLKVDDASVTFEFNGDKKVLNCEQSGLASEHCSGKVEFLWRYKGNYTLSDSDGKVVTKDAPGGLSKIRFYSGVSEQNSPDLKEVVLESGQDHGTVTLDRNHNKYYWAAIGVDLQGNNVGYAWRSWPYVAEFTTSNYRGPSLAVPDYDHHDTLVEEDYGECVDAKGVHYDWDIDWAGQNIKKINVNCTMTGSGAKDPQVTISNKSSFSSKTDQADGNAYGPQNGVIHIKAWVGDVDNWTSETNCSISAETYDGNTINRNGVGHWYNCTYDD